MWIFYDYKISHEKTTFFMKSVFIFVLFLP